MYNKNNLVPIEKGDKIFRVIYKTRKDKELDTMTIAAIIVLPKRYDYKLKRKAKAYFIGEDGTPEKCACSHSCMRCKGYQNNKYDNCRYTEENICKKRGFFYEKIPDGASVDEVNEIITLLSDPTVYVTFKELRDSGRYKKESLDYFE